MENRIYREIVPILISGTDNSNSSLIELCVSELSVENYSKAIDFSEELIKREPNGSIGWVLKSISQSHLFDYGQNLQLLKSSTLAFQEFYSKTGFAHKDIIQIEGVYVTSLLNRSIHLLEMKMNEVAKLKKEARSKKKKATAAALTSIASAAYAGSKNRSSVGKSLGYAGAAAAAIGAASLAESSKLLDEASKGIFGAAIGNIVMTINYGKSLNKNIDHLNPVVREAAAQTLENWTISLARLYTKVLQNLVDYSGELSQKNIFSTNFVLKSKNFIDSSEANQFLYLSHVLGFDKSIEGYVELEESFKNLKALDSSKIKSSINLQYILIILLFLTGIGIQTSFELDSKSFLGNFSALLVFSPVWYIAFFGSFFPLGLPGNLRKNLKSLNQKIQQFKKTKRKALVEHFRE